MRKKYQKLKITISVLFLTILISGAVFITYQKAETIASEYVSYALEQLHLIEDESIVFYKWGENNTDITLSGIYNHYSQINLREDVGFYSMIIDYEGNKLGEYQNFITVEKADNGDTRYILLGDEPIFEDEHSWVDFAVGIPYNFEIKGTCDDDFIYPEEIRWQSDPDAEYVSYIPKKNETDSGYMNFKSWAGDTFEKDYWISVTVNEFLYGDNKTHKKLNEEAKEYCDLLYQEFLNGSRNKNFISSRNLFNYYVGTMGFLNEEVIAPHIFVFHPIKIAIKDLLFVYIVLMIFGFISIVATCILIERAYEQELKNETNRRELTRNIAHELKTPLAVTRGYIENWQYLDDSDKDETTQTLIDEIDHMNKMVVDLLDLSHLEAKSKELHIENVDLYTLTKSVIKRTDKLIKERQLQITLIPDALSYEDEFVVEADLEMMRTVLVNFISNAVKYADKEIAIYLQQNNKKVEFKIENDGTPIDKEKIEKIWDEFYKGNATDRTNIGSSGLGLSITKNILILHKAKYNCNVKNGKTSFSFEIRKTNG